VPFNAHYLLHLTSICLLRLTFIYQHRLTFIFQLRLTLICLLFSLRQVWVRFWLEQACDTSMLLDETETHNSVYTALFNASIDLSKVDAVVVVCGSVIGEVAFRTEHSDEAALLKSQIANELVWVRFNGVMNLARPFEVDVSAGVCLPDLVVVVVNDVFVFAFAFAPFFVRGTRTELAEHLPNRECTIVCYLQPAL
jgi:hypothetical protein